MKLLVPEKVSLLLDNIGKKDGLVPRPSYCEIFSCFFVDDIKLSSGVLTEGMRFVPVFFILNK